MQHESERSKSRKEEKQHVKEPDPKTNQENPGEDSMRSEENDTSERRDTKKTPDHKGETQKVNEA